MEADFFYARASVKVLQIAIINYDGIKSLDLCIFHSFAGVCDF